MIAFEDAEGFTGRLGLFYLAGSADPLLVYAFAQRGWGKEYATDSVGLFLDWMRSAQAMASARVAKKFGAVRKLDVWSLPITR
jgi:RimJ/RimL family protein N-acetyltransferase